jgi:hypothetical protein
MSTTELQRNAGELPASLQPGAVIEALAFAGAAPIKAGSGELSDSEDGQPIYFDNQVIDASWRQRGISAQ